MALSGLERAEERATEMQKQWQQALAGGNNLKAEQWEKKLEDAEQELKKAKKELKEAEQKYEAKASGQAGREQAGGLLHVQLLLLPLVCSTPAWSSCVSCGPPLLLFGGHALLSARILLVVSFTVWLAALRGVGGAFGAEGSWLL